MSTVASQFSASPNKQLTLRFISNALITASTQTTQFVNADGIDIFYRSAGPANGRVLLLLHGFPYALREYWSISDAESSVRRTASYQYRNLINSLSHKYRVIAPDLPGFGFTVVPTSRNYEYTFANFGKTIEAFLDALKITKFAMYIFD